MGLIFGDSMPRPHPATDVHNHLLPRIQSFIKAGNGLGLEKYAEDPLSHLSKLPKPPKLSDVLSITKDEVSDHVVAFFSKDTVDKALKHVHAFFSKDTVHQASATISAWYLSHDPMNLALGFCFYTSIWVWLAAEVTGNYSQVDRLWTFLPVIYSGHFTFYQHFASHGITKKLFSYTGARGASWQEAIVPEGVDPRMLLVFLLQMVWCTRLSLHALTRGFFNPREEDYRWPVLRKQLPKPLYKIVAFVFIAFIQNILLFATSLPQYVLLTSRASEHPTHAPPALGLVDLVLAAAYLGVIGLEATADFQQQSYQKWKRSTAAQTQEGRTPEQIANDRGKLVRGFRTDGLFAWSRHPNAACEQVHWYILYLFTLRATVPSKVFSIFLAGIQQVAEHSLESKSVDVERLVELFKEIAPHFVNYSLIGPVSMTLLLYASTNYTEAIATKKYPLYKSYQKRVPMFWPADLPFKWIWLKATGQLSRLNEEVYGSAKPSDVNAIKSK